MVFNELKIKEGKNEWFFTKKPDFKVPEKFDFASKLRKWINETYAPLFVTSMPLLKRRPDWAGQPSPIRQVGRGWPSLVALGLIWRLGVVT